MTRPHLPVITTDTASCTCGRWQGPTRPDAASVGVFTITAYEAHANHVQTVNNAGRKHDGQADLFGQSPLFVVTQ